ncbi:hypothetical protein RCL1_007097 [Eukaryota sp. TZLM3-RCL]
MVGRQLKKLCFFQVGCLMLMRLFLLFTILASVSLASDFGTFLCINDVHYQWYFREGSDPFDGRCHSGTGSTGKFGHFNCDSPLELITSAFSLFKAQFPDPDFILHIGDIMPHKAVLQGVTEINETTILTALSNFTSIVQRYYPSKPIINVLGNHDTFPAHQYSRDNSWLYEGTLKLWDRYIPRSEHESYVKGGYYKVDLSEFVTMIVLNSNYYTYLDSSSYFVSDPNGQIAWLKKQLATLKKAGKRVIIASHVALGNNGFSATAANMLEHHHKALLVALNDYTDVITAVLAGHEHSDSFRLFKGKLGVVPVLVAPSLAPWASVEYNGYPGNNPGVRVYKYDKKTGIVLDFVQYYLDLEQSNNKGVAVWNVEYSAVDFYKVADLSGESMQLAMNYLRNNPAALDKYFDYLNVLVRKGCDRDKTLDKIYLCGMENVAPLDFSNCLFAV